MLCALHIRFGGTLGLPKTKNTRMLGLPTAGHECKQISTDTHLAFIHKCEKPIYYVSIYLLDIPLIYASICEYMYLLCPLHVRKEDFLGVRKKVFRKKILKRGDKAKTKVFTKRIDWVFAKKFWRVFAISSVTF